MSKLVYVEYCGDRLPRMCETVSIYTYKGRKICDFNAVHNQHINNIGEVHLNDGHLFVTLRSDEE